MRSKRAIAVAGVAALAAFAVALRGACGTSRDNVAYAARPRSVERDERAAQLEAPRDDARRERAAVEGGAPDEALTQPAAEWPYPSASAEQIARWIEDLRDDDIPKNARNAVLGLQGHMSLASDALAAVVNSDDEQQRKLALYLLADSRRSLDLPRAAELYVAELAADDLPRPRVAPRWMAPGGEVVTQVHNAGRAAEWLLEHADLARPALEAAWRTRTGASSDLKLELALAALLALDELSRVRWEACELLIERMRDNDVPQDAALAFDVLSEVGPQALWLVDRAWPTADEQQRAHLSHWLSLNAPSDPRGGDDELHLPLGMVRYGARRSLMYGWLWPE
jgi:hypothetical protein